MTRHHEDKAKHMGGQVDEISIETRAYTAYLSGVSTYTIAQKLLGRTDTSALRAALDLIAAGRKKALGAH